MANDKKVNDGFQRTSLMLNGISDSVIIIYGVSLMERPKGVVGMLVPPKGGSTPPWPKGSCSSGGGVDPPRS